MSAYLVSRAHIAALVETALHGATDAEPAYRERYGPRRQESFTYWWDSRRTRRDSREIGADALGQMLLDANIDSLHARYPDTIDHDEHLPGRIDEPANAPYSHPRNARRLTIAQTAKALDGYDYQACEHAGWKTSEAHAFTGELRRHLLSTLAGYDAADWSINS